MSSILQSYIRMMKSSLWILHLVSAIYGPESHSRDQLIILSVIVRGEERNVGAMQILVQQAICLRIFGFSDKPESTAVEVLSDFSQIVSMLLAIFDAHLSLPVWNHFYRIHILCHLKELSCQIKQLGCIIRLFQIQLFIPLLILFSHSIIENIPYFQVSAIHRILEQLLHRCLSLS